MLFVDSNGRQPSLGMAGNRLIRLSSPVLCALCTMEDSEEVLKGLSGYV